MAKMKPAGKILLIALAAGAVFAAKTFWWDNRPQEATASTEIGKVILPDAPNASLSKASTMLPLPSNKPAANGGAKIRHLMMAWSAQTGCIYANGGTVTTQGSLFDKANLDVTIERQDNCDRSIAELVKFAQDYKNDPTTPAVFCSYMGDGMPTFFSNLQKALKDLGPDYQAIGFYAMGKSYGEDALIGPKEWKTNPNAAIGKTIACYLRDGDMNVGLNWAGNNGKKVNPDETTFDSTAINLVSATDFLDAANKYIAGYTEERFLVRNGKKLNQKVTVGVDAVATWTPGDVNIAQQKGGLVRIVSTKEYSSQMPNITITIKKWANDHRTDVENWIAAVAQAGDQVRSFTEAKKYAFDCAADVWGEKAQGKNGAYWMKYADGVTERDAQGVPVQLGGSMVFNLVDAANMFGLATGDSRPIDRYKAVYTTFGDILKKMYPQYLGDYPPYSQVIDKSFLSTVMSNHPELLEGQAIKVEYAPQMTEHVSEQNFNIQFETGSAVVKLESYATLDEILKSAIVAEDLKLGVYGHTDNTGDPGKNKILSEARADAVADYMRKKGMSGDRIEVKGFGDEQPLATNATAAGRAQNRRVTIVLGQ